MAHPYQLCEHGEFTHSCWQCDVDSLSMMYLDDASVVGRGMYSPVALQVMKQESLDRKAKAEYDREMVMAVARRPKDCEHISINYITNGKDDLTVWCRDCGENVPKSRAKEAKLEIYKEKEEIEEPPHELDVIQRLSEAYRANEREIETEEPDKEKAKTLGTIFSGPK